MQRKPFVILRVWNTWELFELTHTLSPFVTTPTSQFQYIQYVLTIGIICFYGRYALNLTDSSSCLWKHKHGRLYIRKHTSTRTQKQWPKFHRVVHQCQLIHCSNTNTGSCLNPRFQSPITSTCYQCTAQQITNIKTLTCTF